MSAMRLPVELIDVEGEADSIADALSIALENGDVRAMRYCFTRLVNNHRNIVHILTELCEEVAGMKGAGGEPYTVISILPDGGTI